MTRALASDQPGSIHTRFSDASPTVNNEKYQLGRIDPTLTTILHREFCFRQDLSMFARQPRTSCSSGYSEEIENVKVWGKITRVRNDILAIVATVPSRCRAPNVWTVASLSLSRQRVLFWSCRESLVHCRVQLCQLRRVPLFGIAQAQCEWWCK